MAGSRTRYPPLPVDVRVVLTDGSVIPVDLFYLGLGGITRRYMWRLAWTPRGQIHHMIAGSIPRDTSIRLSVR